MDAALNSALFPSLLDPVRARWAPVFFEPISGSYERFVIGVAAVNESGFHLEIANRLDRLNCFYGQDAVGAIKAIKIAGGYLQTDLARRSIEALNSPDPAVTGVGFGPIREAEGKTLEAIAQSWMVALSSLYFDSRVEAVETGRELADGGKEREGSADRLPFLVCDYVKEKRVGFADFFSREIREGKQKRVKGSSHKIVIDFSGSKLVANFGTLKAGSLTGSVNLIKRRLWDLKVERDGEPNSVIRRQHEMILQRPPADDPQITEAQQSNLAEAFEALKHQAEQEELSLRAMRSVQQIGEHIFGIEAA